MTGLRPVRPDEVPALLDLWVVSWSDVYPGISFAGRRDWFGDHVRGWTARGGACLVADDGDGTPAGFVLHDMADGHLDQFCVRSDLKGTGFAVRLMAAVRRLSPAGIHLDVNALNRRAIRFYEREGFVKTGEGTSPTSGLPIFYYAWRP